MKMRIEDLGEPDLEFGNAAFGKDPKRMLADSGPFGVDPREGNSTIKLGLVGLPTEVPLVLAWLRQMHSLLLEDESNIRRFHEFPGVEKSFRCKFVIPDAFVRELDQNEFDICMAQSSNVRFEKLLELFGAAVRSLFSDKHPDAILVCFPEDVAQLKVSNPKLSHKEQRILERLQREEEEQQYELFEPTPEEKKAAAELLPQAEELMYRNFHRALKAASMMQLNCIPLQIIRRQTYVPEEAKQSNATRAWNLGTALYYKAGNIPWRPHKLANGTCFIGVSFHHLKRRSGDIVYASVAQAFSTELEPFALKGESISPDQTRQKRPFLNQSQASNLVSRIVDAHRDRSGSYPDRVVVHKTTQYEPEEVEGFNDGLLSKVPVNEMVWVRPSGFRLLRRGMREPIRGTLCTIEDDHYLFTTGYVPWWKEYPGPHIPAPLQIGTVSGRDIHERAREILTLTKMNWNSAEGLARHPITLTFARRVGTMMTEMDEGGTPNPLYRFYM